MSFRNRCTLLGANGKIDLSIPILGGRSQKTLVKDVLIDHRENWRARHIKTIVSGYNRSPWFDFYRDELEALYSMKYDSLLEWNLVCFGWICAKMSLTVTHSLSESYQQTYTESGVADWRNHLMPSTINTVYPDVQQYTQVFGDRFGFTGNLSILDYLFCNGARI